MNRTKNTLTLLLASGKTITQERSEVSKKSTFGSDFWWRVRLVGSNTQTLFPLDIWISETNNRCTAYNCCAKWIFCEWSTAHSCQQWLQTRAHHESNQFFGLSFLQYSVYNLRWSWEPYNEILAANATEARTSLTRTALWVDAHVYNERKMENEQLHSKSRWSDFNNRREYSHWSLTNETNGADKLRHWRHRAVLWTEKSNRNFNQTYN